ncbi:MAG: methyltransferase domain-containing protein [Flavobacteriales bacterium]|nr:MAG: methyltransferase domain-containing protein [Flavobacteriales bacterium]
MKISSPLIEGAEAFVVDRIPSQDVQAWYSQIGIDVKPYFKNTDTVYIAECVQSGYRFYAPRELMGQGSFYKQLSDAQGEKYYPKARWEHLKALQYFKSNDKVLEIGPGHLAFAQLLKESGVTDITGLEINPTSFNLAESLGVNLLDQTVAEHAEEIQQQYDVVCSFQVLEHVYDVGEFIKACTILLKPGGTLIIAVPNNDSFIQGENLAFNAPPHHMGLWTERVLVGLTNYFPLTFRTLWREPLRTTEVNRWMHWKEQGLVSSRFMRVVLYRFGLRYLVIGVVKLFRKNMRGQSMLAIFCKK